MAQPESDRDREPPAEHKPWFRRPMTVAILLGGLLLVAILLVQVAPGIIEELYASPSRTVHIFRLPPETEAPPVNETDLRERMPGLVMALDDLVESGEKRRHFPATETTMRWCTDIGEIGEEYKDCPFDFEYRGVAFTLGLTES